MSCIIAVGDPHVQTSNLPDVDLFIVKLCSLIKERKPEMVVILGDMLHTHERLHTSALNKAYEMVERVRACCDRVILVVGNHDMINNQVHLTNDHWMNGMKEWNGITVVDTVITEKVGNGEWMICPYVFPGRFVEALETYSEQQRWKEVTGIFAHQEFRGCKMGAIESVEGDHWDLNSPLVVSGHIHSRQRPQENVYYPGSAMQHAFGESTRNIIPVIHLGEDGSVKDIEEVDLCLPRKKIVTVCVEDVDEWQCPKTDDKIRLTIKGDMNEFKTLKKSKKYKELVKKGVKVVFKPLKTVMETSEGIVSDENFSSVLKELVAKEKDPYLYSMWEQVLNDKIVHPNDIMVL